MIALKTKVLPATNTRGTRIAVSCPTLARNRRFVTGWDHSLGEVENHLHATVLFLDRYAPISIGGLRHAGSVGNDGVGIHTYATCR